ncbi:helix-turn-helix transcriptional regulator [Anaerocolumna sp. AGMB13025]|uniref:helix-turn-helix domain-containing protein n=1 Tax=Anaerocolumna sp. AGMB13025 TaxID=3039116 RepID=UPI00241D6516|nr:helix-turn-helix transcriptional regulator [Anaerocolumna sp. AGMB13025]WFR55131.1 helix-turn-helix transcriptional regulator [Anaerocolumna sp. AGMB13025]
MTIGDRLRELRENLGFMQITVSKKIGISNKVLSNYENNISTPDLQTLILLCSFYKVSSDYLLGLTIKEPLAESKVTEEEKKILNYYNRLNEENKDASKGFMINLFREQQNTGTTNVKKGFI